MTRSSFLEKLLAWRFLFVVNALVIMFLSLSLGREFLRDREIRSEISAMQTQAEELTAKNDRLLELRSAIQTPSAIEREARLKLGLKKPDEQVVVIQSETATSSDSVPDLLSVIAEQQEQSKPLSNPRKWWYYFFDRAAYNRLLKL